MGKKTCLTYVELPKKYLAACLKVLVNTFCVCYMDFMLKKIQKLLILAFEANSESSPNCTFFQILEHQLALCMIKRYWGQNWQNCLLCNMPHLPVQAILQDHLEVPSRTACCWLVICSSCLILGCSKIALHYTSKMQRAN